jgi:hypothetical protein
VLQVILYGHRAAGASGRPGAGPAIALSFALVAIVCGFAALCYCTVFYLGVAIVLTGIQPWQSLRNAAPVANALEAIGVHRVEQWVTVGALMGMISSLPVFQLRQARVWFSMSRDGLLPRAFSRVHPRFRTPDVATWIAGVFVGVLRLQPQAQHPRRRAAGSSAAMIGTAMTVNGRDAGALTFQPIPQAVHRE